MSVTNEPKFRGDEPGVNWLIHVLRNNVGKNEWVPRNDEEQEVHRKKMKKWGLPKKEQEYPYKVVTHPIPEGVEMKLECSKQYIIACNNLDIREWLIGMAERLHWFQDEYYRLLKDAAPWHPASEWPDDMNSSCRCRPVQVDSSALRYIGSFFEGFHDYRTDTWYVRINGKTIPHAVEQWRGLPRAPGETAEYEIVEAEAERLRKEAGIQQ